MSSPRGRARGSPPTRVEAFGASGTDDWTIPHARSRSALHTFLLDRTLGFEGRLAPLPDTVRSVDWASGCAWVLRRETVRSVGPLDEGYFMYCEDVDYCRRIHDAGWEVVVTPDVMLGIRLGRLESHPDGSCGRRARTASILREVPSRRGAERGRESAGEGLAPAAAVAQSACLARRFALASRRGAYRIALERLGSS